jgi:hypothetical protein
MKPRKPCFMHAARTHPRRPGLIDALHRDRCSKPQIDWESTAGGTICPDRHGGRRAAMTMKERRRPVPTDLRSAVAQ